METFLIILRWLCSVVLVCGMFANVIFQLFFWSVWKEHQDAKNWIIISIMLLFIIAGIWIWLWPIGLASCNILWIVAFILIVIQLVGFEQTWKSLRSEYHYPSKKQLWGYFVGMIVFAILFNTLQDVIATYPWETPLRDLPHEDFFYPY